ncbi:MAG: hypothetical protein KDJ73_07035 [Notoacmeibacter sp.]|nr:hypothetical protein [Notoacmeibacter sp.]MCC0033562.1 hypothetical protein [Brucellaceae bacterium]
MATILQFTASRKVRRPERAGKSAKVIIFPGIRYETVPATERPAQETASRPH